jgi:hypothetical protein
LYTELVVNRKEYLYISTHDFSFEQILFNVLILCLMIRVKTSLICSPLFVGDISEGFQEKRDR